MAQARLRFFNLLTGVIRPTRGSVIFEGEDITGKKPHNVAKKGMIRTFQGTNIFPDFTVLDNIVLSCHLKPGVGFLETCRTRGPADVRDREILDRSLAILREVGLDGLAHVSRGTLPTDTRRTLGIAAAWPRSRSSSSSTSRSEA